MTLPSVAAARIEQSRTINNTLFMTTGTDDDHAYMHELYDKYAFALKFSSHTTTYDTLAVNGVHYDRIDGRDASLREFGFVWHEIDARRCCYVFALPGDHSGAVYMFVGRMSARGDTSNFILYGICDQWLVLDAVSGAIDGLKVSRFLRRKNRFECLVPTQTSRFSVLATPLRYTVLGKTVIFTVQFYPGRLPPPCRTATWEMETATTADTSADQPAPLIVTEDLTAATSSVTTDMADDKRRMPPPSSIPTQRVQVDVVAPKKTNRRKSTPVMHVSRDASRTNNKRRRINQTRRAANMRPSLLSDDDDDEEEEEYYDL